MSFDTVFLKYSTVFGLLLLLSGCFDSDMNIVLTSDKTAKGVLTIVGPTKDFEETTFGPEGSDLTIGMACTVMGKFDKGNQILYAILKMEAFSMNSRPNYFRP